MKRYIDRALPILTVAALLVGWSIYVRAAGVSPLLLPTPERILAAFGNLLTQPKVWHHAWITIVETSLGFTFASVAGILLGTVLAKVPLLEKCFSPILISMQLVPKIALAPLFILWFGFGIESKIVISAVIAFFPVFANTLVAMKSIDQGDREVFRSLRAGKLQTFMHLELPSSLPVILTGMEVAIVLAIIGAVVGEFLGGNQGLGYLTVVKLQQLDVGELFGVVLLLTLIGLAMYLFVVMLRRALVPWHQTAALPA